MDKEKVKKIWNVVKTIIEIVIAALVGGATASAASLIGLF